MGGDDGQSEGDHLSCHGWFGLTGCSPDHLHHDRSHMVIAQ